MKLEENYLGALISQHAKPVIKQAFNEAFQEFLSENKLTITQSHMSNADALISTSEALRLLGGINRQTLYRYISRGLPAYRNGKSYKFRVCEINEFINQNNRTK